MIVGTVFSIMPAFVYWLAGCLAIQNDPGAPTVGDIVAFTTLQSRLFFPLGQLLNVQVEVQGALALFDRIFEYLDLKPDIADAPTRWCSTPPRCAAPSASATSRSATRASPGPADGDASWPWRGDQGADRIELAQPEEMVRDRRAGEPPRRSADDRCRAPPALAERARDR